MKSHFVRLLTVLMAVWWLAPANPVKAQDPEFSQFYAAPLHLNPALAGISMGPRFILNYRNQWPSLDDAFVTYAISYDQHFDAISGGVGVILLADRIAGGILNTYTAGAMYAYQLRLGRNFGIKIGAEVAYTFKQIDWAAMRFGDQINPVYGFLDEFNNLNPTMEQSPESEKISYVDFSAGFVGFSKTWFAGAAVKHITQPNESFQGSDEKSARLPIRFAAHGGAVIHLDERSRANPFISPNIMFLQQSNFTQVNAGTYFNYNPVYLGVWYRHTFNNADAVIALAGFQINVVRVGYSYDFTLSDLSGHSGGAHELSLTVNFGGDDSSINTRQGILECPSILKF